MATSVVLDVEWNVHVCELCVKQRATHRRSYRNEVSRAMRVWQTTGLWCFNECEKVYQHLVEECVFLYWCVCAKGNRHIQKQSQSVIRPRLASEPETESLSWQNPVITTARLLKAEEQKKKRGIEVNNRSANASSEFNMLQSHLQFKSIKKIVCVTSS